MSVDAIADPLVGRFLNLPAEWHGRTAFASAAGGLSFAELREGMLKFAGWLRDEARISPGDRVAICLPKSLEAVLVMYGVFAAGAAYVPLQHQGPPARLRAILASIRPHLLLATAESAASLAAVEGPGVQPPTQAISVRDDGAGLEPLLRGRRAKATIPRRDAGDLAWVIFTSGSTGDPKGVMLSHGNMAANVLNMHRRDGVGERDLRISHAGLHYVASLDLLFPPFSGSRVVLLSEREAMFPDRVAEAIERERATLWSSSVTALRLLLERGDLERRDLRSLRRISFYGEPMPVDVLRRLLAALPSCEFVNHYGATEAHSMASYLVPRPLPASLEVVPLGRPTDFCGLTLRDEDGREVAVGEVGEICVVGPAVTLGYWDDPALTQARRLPGQPNSFRSGDLARFGADGLLHSAGRRDHLVKLRGHRFDLGEIEAVLRRHGSVRAAVAFAVAEEGGQAIMAAVLVEAGAEPGAELAQICHDRLPSFARPRRIVTLGEFPLTSTGKVDRIALTRIVVDGAPRRA